MAELNGLHCNEPVSDSLKGALPLDAPAPFDCGNIRLSFDESTELVNIDHARDSAEYPDEHEWSFIEGTFRLIQEILTPEGQNKSSVTHFKQPDELHKCMGIGLSRTSNPINSVELLALCRQMVNFSLKTGHVMFRNTLYGGCDVYGLAAAILVEALNTNAYTFEAAPVFTMIEHEVIKQLVHICGFSEGDGIFCPGGSLSNMYGISLAKFKFNEKLKETGLNQVSKQMVILTSEQSHYSVKKGAAFMGFGTDAVVNIKCLKNGSMDAEDLELQVQKCFMEGKTPFVVSCTSGTTVLSAFDPLFSIAEVCKKWNLWMHVDACLGGAYLLSEASKHLLKGIERSDSVTWNWHKILGAPIQTSVLLTKHTNLLKAAHSSQATYLFDPKKKYYDTMYDLGEATVQCGRKADAVKVWMMWKARGLGAIGQRVDEAVHIAHYFLEQMEKSPRFRLVLPQVQGSTVCFWVLPPDFDSSFPAENEAYWSKLSDVTLTVKARMVTRGLAMIACQPLPEQALPHFFRLTIVCHPRYERKHADHMIQILIKLTDDL